MGTSIGGAIDYIVANLPAPVAAVDATAVVADNDPIVTSKSLVVIGRNSPEDGTAADGSQMIVVLGANERQEGYTIPCFVSVYRPGPAQKPARDAAIALFDVVGHLIAADVTLGGLLQQGRRAEIQKMQLVQTRDSNDTGDSGAMRLALITFDINCTNTYAP